MNREQRRSAPNLGAVIKVDGVSYEFEPSEVSGAVELELYRQSGLVLSSVLEDVKRAPASFHIAAMVFLARRARGDEITFDAIASAIRVTSEFEMHFPEGDDKGTGDGPEALAAD